MSRFFNSRSNQSDATTTLPPSSRYANNNSYANDSLHSKQNTVDATVVKETTTTAVVGGEAPSTYNKDMSSTQGYITPTLQHASYDSNNAEHQQLNKQFGAMSTGYNNNNMLHTGQYRGSVASAPATTIAGGGFSVTKLEEQELLARGEQIPGKVIRLPEHTGFTMQHPEICIAQEKLLISHQPIRIAQPPVVIQPEAITIPQQPFMWQPEPIAIPLPPLTIQPEAITIQREALTVNPDAYVIHRPNLVLNGSFAVKLAHEVEVAQTATSLSTASVAHSSNLNSSVGSGSLSNRDSTLVGSSRSSYAAGSKY